MCEQAVELGADLAALRFAVFPLVRVGPQRGVRLAVAETALDVDEVVVECDQHARVAVAQVVQGRLRRWQLGCFVSRTGFRGDLDSRVSSWGEEILRCHVEAEEVSRGVARARCAVGA